MSSALSSFSAQSPSRSPNAPATLTNPNFRITGNPHLTACCSDRSRHAAAGLLDLAIETASNQGKFKMSVPLTLLFEVVILTLERSEGEGSLYFVFVLSYMGQGTPTLILL
jgi:hypothetical protein